MELLRQVTAKQGELLRENNAAAVLVGREYMLRDFANGKPTQHAVLRSKPQNVRIRA